MPRHFSYYLVLFLIAIALHTAWEFTHQSLYTVQGQAVPWPRLAQSIIGDGFITVFIYLLAKRRWWLVATIGLCIAAAVEINAVYIRHLWEYRQAMPTFFGLGLSSLLQMGVLPALSIWLADRIFARFKNL